MLLQLAGFPAKVLWLSILPVLQAFISLLASWYVYDYCDLYTLRWFRPQYASDTQTIASFTAGYDETSAELQKRFAKADVRVFDFYDPQEAGELSIRRARALTRPFPSTVSLSQKKIPVSPGSFQVVFAFFSLHEIRNEEARTEFLRELARVLTPGGEIWIAEHLRNSRNFMAFNIGFFHFYSEKTWIRAFSKAGLVLHQRMNTSFLTTTFILRKNGTAA